MNQFSLEVGFLQIQCKSFKFFYSCRANFSSPTIYETCSRGLGKSLSMISLIATDEINTHFQPQTLIVVPLSLLQTWDERLNEHIAPNALKWLVYHPSRGSIPLNSDISSYDVVITTYDTVSSQWRNASGRIQPLFLVNWHRLILDEGPHT